MMDEQGTPCPNAWEHHAIRFKTYLLELLPEWTEFSKGNQVYISTNRKAGNLLAEAHKTQLGQDDALLMMRAAVIMRKCCLQRPRTIQWFICRRFVDIFCSWTTKILP